jgi:hypothetical protein
MHTATSQQRSIRPCTLVDATLILLTVVTWGIGRSGLGGLYVSLLVLGFALLKGHMVGDWFMGLRGLRGIWRWVVLLWLTIPGALVTTAFVLSNGG